MSALPEAEPPATDRASDPPPLSVRERDVLAGLLRGLVTKEIAEALGVSAHSVRTYRQRVYRKLGVHATGELMLAALRFGLVDCASIAVAADVDEDVARRVLAAFADAPLPGAYVRAQR